MYWYDFSRSSIGVMQKLRWYYHCDQKQLQPAIATVLPGQMSPDASHTRQFVLRWRRDNRVHTHQGHHPIARVDQRLGTSSGARHKGRTFLSPDLTLGKAHRWRSLQIVPLLQVSRPGLLSACRPENQQQSAQQNVVHARLIGLRVLDRISQAPEVPCEAVLRPTG